jgi:hypothetical protein
MLIKLACPCGHPMSAQSTAAVDAALAAHLDATGAAGACRGRWA